MEMSRKSWGAALSRAFLWLLLPVAVAAMQLPPDIQADRHLLQAERAIQEQDFQGAKTAMDAILELQEQHDLELPEQFSFRYAEVLGQLGIYDEAVEFVTQYLTMAGQDGEFYRDALELLDRIEQTQAMELCAEDSWGVSCWKALADPSQCAIWEESHIPFPIRPATWSGPCVFGRAHGEGTLSWTDDDGEGSSGDGQFQNGKKQGLWFERSPNGNTETGPYVDGVRNGQWTLTTADGSDNDGRVKQGRYVNGEPDGSWELSWPSGQTLRYTYANGILSGPSVRRFRNGSRVEGRFVDGLREGERKGITASGMVWFTETYAAGTMHGPSSRMHEVYVPGCRSTGDYVDGKKEGRWTECEESPNDFPRSQNYILRELLWTGDYVGGVKHGPWEGQLYESVSYGLEDEGGNFLLSGRVEGVFDNGKESGFITTVRERFNNPNMADGCYEGAKVPFVDGQRHGTGWIRREESRGRDCECMKITWGNGEEVERDEVSGRTCRREIFKQ